MAWPIAFGLLPTVAFIPFLRHADYPLLSSEALLACGLLSLAGLAIGLVARAGGRRIDVLAGAAFILLGVDITTSAYGLADRLTVWITALVGGLLVSFLLRKQVATLAAAATIAAWLAGFMTPAAPSYFEATGNPSAKGAPELPPIIHIILDAQIGIEGVNLESDPEAVMLALAKTYQEMGFRVSSRAFSRHRNTSRALPAAFQFTSQREKRKGNEGNGFGENFLFEELKARGYALHVIGTEYLDFCLGRSDVASCVTSPVSTVRELRDAELSVGRKAELLLLSFSTRARLVHALRRRAERIAGLGSIRHGNLSASLGMAALTRLPDLMSELAPGQFWLVHLLLPHGPYAFDATCILREELWLQPEADQGGASNTSERRLRSYSAYMDQMRCLHARLKEFIDELPKDAIVVLHGDHGSRITTAPQYRSRDDRLTFEQILDDYSILFAIRSPIFDASLDRRLLPLDELLREVYAPHRKASESMTLIYEPIYEGRPITLDMPVFSDPRIEATSSPRDETGAPEPSGSR